MVQPLDSALSTRGSSGELLSVDDELHLGEFHSLRYVVFCDKSSPDITQGLTAIP
jgi:hypothetical protein